MESKNKCELSIRKASTYDLKFPDNKYLEETDKKGIQMAVRKGGIAVNNKTYISEKQLPKLLSTDRKGVTNILMNTPSEELKTIDDEEYMSSAQTQKVLAERSEQPRGIIEQEKLKYAMGCVQAFANNDELNKCRAIEAERIIKGKPALSKKIISERESKVSELSGLPLEGKAEVHHKDRIADKPERAFDRTNLTVIRSDEHKEYHSSDYPQNEKGYSQFEKDYKKKKTI